MKQSVLTPNEIKVAGVQNNEISSETDGFNYQVYLPGCSKIVIARKQGPDDASFCCMYMTVHHNQCAKEKVSPKNGVFSHNH